MSDLMLLDKYAEAVKNRDWFTCDLIADEVKPLLNKIQQLQKQLEDAEKVIDYLWENEPDKTLMLDKIQEYLKTKDNNLR